MFSLFSWCRLQFKSSSSNKPWFTKSLFRSKSAFTLVELIVVITILAILALVAFLMMSDATVSARDSNRLTSIKNIYDASQLQAVQQRLLPLPDQAITLTVSGTDIGWQGYMSGYIAQSYGYSDSVYDPRDNTPYIYRVNQTRNKSQYLAYLENGGEVAQGDLLLAFGGMDGIERIGGVKESKSFAGLGGLGGFGIDTAQATDFSKRVPYVYGDRLGVVLSNTTNEGANVALGSGGTLDLGGGSIDSNYSVYVNEGLKLASVEGTGAVALKTNGGLDQVIANATIVASSGSNSGSGSGSGSNDPTCGLTSQEVIDLNAVKGESYTAGQWCALTSIDWSNSSLTILPNAFVKLTNLEEIYLGGNNLTSLSDNFVHLTKLTTLDFDGNIGLGDLMFSYSVGSNTYHHEASITTLGQEMHIIVSSAQPKIQIIIGSPPTPTCSLTQGEADELNTLTGNNFTIGIWCDQTVLNLNGNNLSTLPNEVLKLTKLIEINLSTNNFSDVPSSLANLPDLRIISIEDNAIYSLSGSIGNFHNLRDLSLWQNHLSTLPSEISGLSNIEYIGLAYNDFSTFPVELNTLTTLQNLIISHNHINSFTTGIGNLVNLTALSIDRNNLSSLPAEIGNLVNLTYLNIEYNNISSLPSSIGNCSNILALYASDNQLTTLPDEIGGLINVSQFYLRNNNISSLPDSIENLDNLHELDLSSNNLSSVPITFGGMSQLTSLNIAANNFSSLPVEIGSLTTLDSLWAPSNSMSSIPTSIGNLIQLHSISLANNNLTSLPDEIGNLHNLQSFFLSYNQLETLPNTIGGLQSITYMDINENQIQTLPDELAEISTLKNFYMYNNGGYLPNISGTGGYENSNIFTISQTNATPTGKTLSIQSLGDGITPLQISVTAP